MKKKRTSIYTEKRGNRKERKFTTVTFFFLHDLRAILSPCKVKEHSRRKPPEIYPRRMSFEKLLSRIFLLSGSARSRINCPVRTMRQNENPKDEWPIFLRPTARSRRDSGQLRHFIPFVSFRRNTQDSSDSEEIPKKKNIRKRSHSL